MSYLYVACTILLMVYAQVVIKWQVLGAGPLPEAAGGKLAFLAGLLINPWIASALAAMLIAALAWMAAMTKLDLSHAYPFTSLAFVLVMIASAFFFHEPMTGPKLLGIALVCLGIVVGSQG